MLKFLCLIPSKNKQAAAGRLFPPCRWLLLAPWLLLAGCGNETAGNETADPDTATVVAPPAKATSLPVNVLLELSGGMRGFMPLNTAATPPTAFQNRVRACGHLSF